MSAYQQTVDSPHPPPPWRHCGLVSGDAALRLRFVSGAKDLRYVAPLFGAAIVISRLRSRLMKSALITGH